jgi:tRNA1Val (adenine37-N6)-methyltransferase
MANPYFQFKQFTVYHDRCAMKVTTDSCFFGAWTAEEIQNSKFKIQNILDIGTGTGLLSLMIAQKNAVKIDAVEIDKEAAAQASENIKASSWKDQIKIFNEDILSFQPEKKYDCIICNPPFYENELASSKEKRNLAHHSEQLTISQVLDCITTHLKENGLFFLMYPYKRSEEIESLLDKKNLYITDTILLQQSTNHSPFRIIVKGTNKKTNSSQSSTIAIWNEHQQYTDAFIGLLKDYYLYL